MIPQREAKAFALLLLAQEGTQPSPNELVDGGEGPGVRVFEVVEPSVKRRVEAFDDAREPLAARAFCLGPNVIFQTVETLLPNKPSASFKTITKEFEPFSLVTAVANMRLVRVQT